jgi:hypothetical protein
MKQLFFVLSLAIPLSTFAPTPDYFNAKTGMIIDRSKNVVSNGYAYIDLNLTHGERGEAKPPMPDLTHEHLSAIFHPITRFETERRILFFARHRNTYNCNSKTRVSLNKETGKIKVDELHCPRRGLMNVSSSPYNNYSVETYNALQALYEKQQQKKGENAGSEEKKD